jgi:hypothetical protein
MYAAPEQRSRGDVDQRADIFALGLMLNEMFTGHVPQGRDYTTIVDVQPMLAYLDSLVEVMIQHHPGKRPQSIDEVRQALDHHLDASIQSEHQEYTKGETQYPGSITTFTFKGQPRYRCPQCKFDSYDLKKVQEHVRLNHAPAREGEAGGLYLLSWHAGSSYTYLPSHWPNDETPTWVRVKNTQVTPSVTAKNVRARLEFVDSRDTKRLIVPDAVWWIDGAPGENGARHVVDIEGDGEQSFILYSRDDQGRIVPYKNAGGPLEALAFDRWEVRLTVTADNLPGCRGKVSFTYTRNSNVPGSLDRLGDELPRLLRIEQP